MYPLERATELLSAWRNYTEQAPDEVTSEVLLWSIPDVADFPEELRGEPTIVVVGMYAGPVEEGERELQPLRELGTPLVDLSAVQPYTAAQSDFDAFFPEGLLYYWKSLYLDRLDDEVINAMVVHAEDRPSPRTLLKVRHLGGALSAGCLRMPPPTATVMHCSTSASIRPGRIPWSPNETSRGPAKYGRRCVGSRTAVYTSTSPVSSKKESSCFMRPTAKTTSGWRP